MSAVVVDSLRDSGSVVDAVARLAPADESVAFIPAQELVLEELRLDARIGLAAERHVDPLPAHDRVATTDPAKDAFFVALGVVDTPDATVFAAGRDPGDVALHPKVFADLVAWLPLAQLELRGEQRTTITEPAGVRIPAASDSVGVHPEEVRDKATEASGLETE